MKSKPFTIHLQPIGRRIEIEPGASLLDAAQKAGVDLVAACSGLGICGTCRVRPLEGSLSPLTPSEEEQLTPAQIAAGYRLACQAVPQSDVRLEIPPESLPTGQKIQLDGRESAVALDPAVAALDLQLDPPHLHDLRSDLTRVQQAAGVTLRAPLAALDQLSQALRENDWKVRLAVTSPPAAPLREAPCEKGRGEVSLLGTFAPQTLLLGLAVDLGSTKLAVYLVDLQTGGTLVRIGVMNPQISYGEDVVSRIAYANRAEGNRRHLQTRLVETLNGAAAELCAQAGADVTQIVDAVVVGNTAMHHFFTGLPVAQLGAAPYVPAVSEPLDLSAAELGLRLAFGARLYLPSNIAGYVGGDHTAALLAALDHPTAPLVLVDIGTNTEISLVVGEQIYSCSTASGPAFEGAHIHDGMRAAPGAVERVRLSGGRAQVNTIGGLAPVGICGSGILQAVAEMLDAGVLDSRGSLQKTAPGVRATDGKSEYLLVPAAQSGHGRDIVITRRDVNEIQLAKGAIRAGIEIMLRKAGIQAADVGEWIIAGAFGTYLDLASAVRVGMFPDQPLERFHQVGNAAGMGAKQMLLSRRERARAVEIAARVNYVELTVESEFTGEFMKAMYL